MDVYLILLQQLNSMSFGKHNGWSNIRKFSHLSFVKERGHSNGAAVYVLLNGKQTSDSELEGQRDRGIVRKSGKNNKCLKSS